MKGWSKSNLNSQEYFKNYVSCDYKIARNSFGEYLRIGETVFDTKLGQKTIIKFFTHIYESNHVKANTPNGYVFIDNLRIIPDSENSYKNYNIPVTWESFKTYEVKAENLQQALQIALMQFLSETDENYLNDSLSVDQNVLNDNYPNEFYDLENIDL